MMEWLVRRAELARAKQRLADAEVAFTNGQVDDAVRMMKEAAPLLDPEMAVRAVAVGKLYEGSALKNQGRHLEAIEALEIARPVFAAQGMRVSLCQCEGIRGRALEALGRYDEALGCFVTALEMSALCQRPSDEATSELNVANMLAMLGRHREAVKHMQRGLELYQRLNDTDGVARCLLGLGGIRNALGERDDARAALIRAREIFARRSDAGVANCDIHLAKVSIDSGEYAEASERIEDAVVVYDRGRMRPELAGAVSLRGWLQAMVGDHERAIQSFENAREMFQELRFEAEVAQCETNIAVVLGELDRHEEAVSRLRNAAAVFKRLHLTGDQAHAQLSMASCLRRLERQGESIDLYRASAAIYERQGILLGAFRARSGMAICLSASGETQSALEEYQRLASDLRLTPYVQDLALCMFNRGQLLVTIGELDVGIEQLSEAKGLFASIGLPLLRAEVDASLGFAFSRAAGRQGMRDRFLASALDAFEEAIRTFEECRGLLVIEENRMRFLDGHVRAYAGAVLTLIQLGRLRAAFDYSEQLRARVLTEAVSVDIAVTASDVGDQLHREFRQITAKRVGAGLFPLPPGPATVESGRIPTQQPPAAHDAELWQWLERVKTSRPDSLIARESHFEGVRALDDFMSHDLLDERTCALEFFVGPSDRLRAFLITRGQGVQLVTFGPRSLEIVAGIWDRWSEVYHGDDVRDPRRLVTSVCEDLYRHIFSAQVDITGDTASSTSQPLIRYLSEMVRNSADHPGRLVLVPQAFLGNLPLHAAGIFTNGVHELLLNRFAVHYAPSIASLHAIRRRTRTERSRAMVVGNPASEYRRGLPSAEIEARDVAAQLMNQGWHVDLLLGLKATKRCFQEGDGGTVAGVNSGTYSHLHLAQHAALEYLRHGVTQRLLFSDVDVAESDSVCEANEIASAPLQDVHCAVLAVCNGGVAHPGRNESRELSAAFLRAGARIVISTASPLDDISSRELVQYLYAARAGRDRSWGNALRDAQLRQGRENAAFRGIPAWACMRAHGLD